jgi:hypothetical protein
MTVMVVLLRVVARKAKNRPPKQNKNPLPKKKPAAVPGGLLSFSNPA